MPSSGTGIIDSSGLELSSKIGAQHTQSFHSPVTLFDAAVHSGGELLLINTGIMCVSKEWGCLHPGRMMYP